MLSEMGTRPMIGDSGIDDDFGKEIGMLLREQRRQEESDREMDLNIYQSGSAPPTVEGSLTAAGGLFTGDAAGGGGLSEEELWSAPLLPLPSPSSPSRPRSSHRSLSAFCRSYGAAGATCFASDLSQLKSAREDIKNLLKSTFCHRILVSKKKNKWILDSGCSKHMTGNSNLFTFLESKEGGTVTFGDNNKGHIIGIGSISNLDKPLIENVLLVKGLEHNLLSISQLCDKGYNVRFECDACVISDANDLVVFRGVRKNNVYELYLSDLSSSDEHCLIACNDAQSLWHMRLGHLNFKYLSKLSKFNLVRGLPNISFKKTHVSDACPLGKLTNVSFKSKNVVSTKRPLELLQNSCILICLG